MNKKSVVKPLSCLCLVAALHGGAGAAAPDADRPVSYADAIRLALARRGELAIEQINVNKMSVRVDEAAAASLPSVDVISTAQRIKSYQDFSGVEVNAFYNNTNIPVTVSAVTPRYQISASLGLSYNLYSGGLNRAKVDEQVAARQRAQAQLETVRKALVLETTVAYWDLRKAQMVHRTAQHGLAYAKAGLVSGQTRFDEGRIARIELDAIALTVETRELELHDRARQVADCLRRYEHALGLDAPDLREAAVQPLTSDAGHVQVDQLLADLGLLQAPEVVIARANVAAAQARTVQAKSEYKPSVDLFASYGGIGRDNSGLSGAVSDYGRDNYSVGVRLKWNLFNGHGSSARASQAAMESELMRLQAAEAQRELTRAWQDKRSREDELKNRLVLAGKQADLAQAELEIAKKRHAIQQSPLVDFQAAQLKVEEATNKVKLAEVDFLVARIATRLASVE